jgi:Protein of unknown function (DUF2794)
MSEGDPTRLRLRPVAARASHDSIPSTGTTARPMSAVTTFTRQELNAILNVYGRKVAAGEWRDYAIDFGRETACFSAYRRTSEVPLYRIEKSPKLSRKQGAFSVIAASGQVLKRGHDLLQVLAVFEKKLRLV